MASQVQYRCCPRCAERAYALGIAQDPAPGRIRFPKDPDTEAALAREIQDCRCPFSGDLKKYPPGNQPIPTDGLRIVHWG